MIQSAFEVDYCSTVRAFDCSLVFLPWPALRVLFACVCLP